MCDCLKLNLGSFCHLMMNDWADLDSGRRSLFWKVFGMMNRGCLLSFESLCDRARAHLSFAPALIGRDAIDGGFDIVERADPIESFLSNLGAVGDVHVIKLAPDMGPACRLDDTVALVEAFESGVTVGMKHAGEVVQMGTRPLTLAIAGVEEHGRRRTLAAIGTFVAHVSPQAAGLGLARSRGEHRDWRAKSRPGDTAANGRRTWRR